jgi:glycine cleavage system H lipoate-binding protein
MTIEAMKQAQSLYEITGDIKDINTLLVPRAAIEAAEKQEPVAWLTKELMADYMDMTAEAIEDNRGEPLRHKAHLLRVRSKT